MTRKHFEAIAYALRASRPALTDPTGVATDEGAQWLRTRDAITRELAAFNPNFDRGRFELATER